MSLPVVFNPQQTTADTDMYGHPVANHDEDNDPDLIAALLLSLEESTLTSPSTPSTHTAETAETASSTQSMPTPVGRAKTGQKSRGSSGSGGRRRQQISLNHLVNFRVAERPSVPVYQAHAYSYARSDRLTREMPTYRKEKFVDANFHFVLRSPGSSSSAASQQQLHRSLLIDADCTPEWESVVAVHSRSQHSYRCPICMEQVLAPRVTKCGHIYCLCCLLRYAAVSEKRWIKCPMCFDIVLLRDLRPAFLTLDAQVGCLREIPRERE
jgi:RING-type zinc-finger